ncbi:bacterial extracellular solute-binding protein, partial [gut metagenome]
CLLGGCGAAPEAASEDTLTIMGNASNLQNPYIQRIFDLYQEETGNKLEIIPVDNESYNDEVLATVDGEDAPDIVMLFNNNLMAELGGTDQFRDLSDQPWVEDLEEGS